MPGEGKLIPPHGGYRKLRSFQCAQHVYDATVIFCNRFVEKRSRTHDQMVQAARSAVQNIAEGSMASATSKKTELKLTGVARASLEELLLDYEDFLRHRGLRIWAKDSPEALAVRRKYQSDKSDESDKSDASGRSDSYGISTAFPEVAANTLICLINQASFLLGRQLQKLEQQFLTEGGFTEPALPGTAGPSEETVTIFTESVVEDAGLAWLEGIGWRIAHGPDISPGGETLTLALSQREREGYGEVVLAQRLRDALAQLNPQLPTEALEDGFRRLTRPEGATLEARNRAFHRMLVDGVTVEYRDDEGAIRGAQVHVIDFERPDNNDWLAVNQFTVSENKHTRRPDVVLFVNGLPLAVIELKNPADEEATIWTAFQQIQTYKAELPTLFAFNELLVTSDGLEARVGTLTAGREWFKPWRTVTGERVEDTGVAELQVLLRGIFDKRRFLDMLRDFIAFDDDGSGKLSKIAAGYHQFHAVRIAVEETLRAVPIAEKTRERYADGRYEAGLRAGGAPGDRRVGVVWHTQGSGKSLTMVFYAGRIIREPAMENPTIVVLTDRNDLDDQLFGTFSRCQDLLRQPPVQAASRADLRQKLAVQAGGVVFTTIQKFFPDLPAASRNAAQAGEKGDRHPVLSERHNIVVIADEAHRSQYDFIDGFARHMRDAPAARFVHRLHRHSDRDRGREHARGVRRLHQRLRHPARGRRRRDGADLLREPAREARTRRIRAAED